MSDVTSTSGDSHPSLAPRTVRRTFRSVAWAGGAALLVVAAAVWWLRPREPQASVIGPASWPSSPFRNTAPEVDFVGSAACVACHPSHDASLRRTGMGRSMAVVDPAAAPADAMFDHAVSKRRYSVHRKDGRVWHREALLTPDKGEVVLNDVPLAFVVGSGRHAQTFLVELDGFLVESPVTWYASRQAWAMSPGYDRPDHAGFQRAVGAACLFCHAGQSEALGGAYHKFKITEPVISCERCHGPGALHVERHSLPRKENEGFAALDDTIVNPAHLPRALADAVCQQCHLRSSAAVAAWGRTERDFRPGLPLQEFRHDFRLETADSKFTVTGHVEQLQLSRCYQASEMTCLTCHEPHHQPRPKRRDEHYQQACLSCHQSAQCTVDPKQRVLKSPANQCVTCHMPRTATEVTHVALTHHRIGKHPTPPPEHAAREFAELRPVLDWLRPNPLERRRALGLGYLEVAGWLTDAAQSDDFKERAIEQLTQARDAGLRESALETALANLQPATPEDLVASTGRILADKRLLARERTDLLLLRADALARLQRYDEAGAALRELIGLRRKAADWLVLADVERAAANLPAAIAAFEQAVAINPRLWKVQRYLADHYRREGNPVKAEFHQQRAVP